MLWEAVRTAWDPRGQTVIDDPLTDTLRQHVAYAAVNRLDEQRGPDARWDRPELDAPDASCRAEVLVDGAAVDGVRLDGDRHVLGIGAVLDGAILTAAPPRAELAHVRVAFETVAWGRAASASLTGAPHPHLTSRAPRASARYERT